MTRICWRLIEEASQLLEPSERDAVVGDLAETGAPAGAALRDLLGLIVRRQAQQWRDWQPWMVLLGLVGPVGLLVSFSSISLVRSYDLYLWIARNYGTIDPAILEQIGLTARHGVAALACGTFLLASWSWASGFVLAAIMRRAAWANGTLFCLVFVFVDLMFPRGEYLYDVTGGMFPLTFYKVIFPLILQTALILIPSIWGMRQGLRLIGLPPVWTILWTAAVVTLLAMRGGFWLPFRASHLMPLAGYWPVWYIIGTTIRRRLRGSAAVA